MIIALAAKGANILCRDTEDPNLYELYHYGLECILNEFITDCLILAIGFACHLPLQMIVWALVFTICRINMGGWHAPSHAICISCSIIAGLVPVLIYNARGVSNNRAVCILALSGYLVWTLLKLPLKTSRHIVSSKRLLFAKSLDAGIICILLISIIASAHISSYLFFSYTALTEAVILTLPVCYQKK